MDNWEDYLDKISKEEFDELLREMLWEECTRPKTLVINEARMLQALRVYGQIKRLLDSSGAKYTSCIDERDVLFPKSMIFRFISDSFSATTANIELFISAMLETNGIDIIPRIDGKIAILIKISDVMVEI